MQGPGAPGKSLTGKKEQQGERAEVVQAKREEGKKRQQGGGKSK